MSQLRDLAKPFAPRLIKQPPKGKYGTYVAHDVVNQKLLAVLGPFEFAITELVRGTSGQIEGCLARLAVKIDGEYVSIVEVGDCESPDNWKTEGARMKDAASDAFKRCAMRLGCGLHLWAGQDFFLFDVLDVPSVSQTGDATDTGTAVEVQPQGPAPTPDRAPTDPPTAVPPSLTAAAEQLISEVELLELQATVSELVSALSVEWKGRYIAFIKERKIPAAHSKWSEAQCLEIQAWIMQPKDPQ